MNRSFLAAIVFLTAGPDPTQGHDGGPVTHRFGPNSELQPRNGIRIAVYDRDTKERIGARLSFEIDGSPFTPSTVNEHGIRFTSIHISKEQQFTVIYSLKSGALVIATPEDARAITIAASRGFEYKPQEVAIEAGSNFSSVRIELDRWSGLREAGWIAIEEHLHYDRLDPEDDRLWLAMLEADGLDAGHFMVLKGGMTPGIWATQYAHGETGQAASGRQSLIPGQEYRDSAQGHINLLGTREIIEPYSTGGLGWPKTVENYPPLHKVLSNAREQGGYVGAAHGGSLGREPTAIADAVLGEIDFWEISNGFIYERQTWYDLMNCGYFLPPMAGTDLPNWPYRDAWQPFLGSIRTYVHTDGATDFDSFKNAMDRGRVLVSGGPIIELSANGYEIGDTIRLPDPGSLIVRGRIRSPLPLREFNLIHDGNPVAPPMSKKTEDGIFSWEFEITLDVKKSGWIAASGKGVRIQSQNIDAIAHTNAIRILVGEQPIRSLETRDKLLGTLKDRSRFYREHGVYKTDRQRQEALGILGQAITELENRL